MKLHPACFAVEKVSALQGYMDEGLTYKLTEKLIKE